MSATVKTPEIILDFYYEGALKKVRLKPSICTKIDISKVGVPVLAQKLFHHQVLVILQAMPEVKKTNVKNSVPL